jgi:GTP-binding protein LepA
MGVVAVVKVVDGSFSLREKRLKMIASKTIITTEEIGYFKLKRMETGKLETGEVGYIATGLKDIRKVKVGDTITMEGAQAELLPGYKEVKPFVFVSIFPTDNSKYPQLREALEKLALTDSALSFEPESSSALGFGFRCGFLGLLLSMLADSSPYPTTKAQGYKPDF